MKVSQITKLDDIFELDVDNLKTLEKSKVITRIKQLLKTEKKVTKAEEDLVETLPYKAVSVVGLNYVEVAFDMDSKKARVIEVSSDPRATGGRNYMSGAKAIKRIQEFTKSQKEITNE